jgi:hypothetical protein
LRKKSNLLKYISGVDYKELPSLEALTGADVMISPDKLPFPRSEKLIRTHVAEGAKLIQIKFGHDLPSSIIDGRLNEALSRMQSCGANPWQCLLLFVGLLGCDYPSGKVTINGQLSYGRKQMTWYQVDCAIERWIDRGGSYNPLSSGKLIPVRFVGTQNRVNEYQDNKVKKIMAQPVKFEKVVEPTNPHLRKWNIAQKIVVQDDFRPLLCAIPGARIGKEKATAIFDYMADNGIHMSFSGFLAIVRDGSIVNVPGIGKGLLNSIRSGLFNTLEEREEKVGQKKRKKKT